MANEAASTARTDEFKMIATGDLSASKTNPRTVFHDKPLGELAASIKMHGVLEPILVRETKGKGFTIVAGERRWRAATKAELKEVPCIVKDLTDEQVLDIQIDENWQRNDLEPMDEARALKFLKESGKVTLDELAARLNKDIRFLHNRLKLNDLLPEFQKALDEGRLPVTHAQVVARYEQDKQKIILKECFYGTREITLRDLESNIGRYVEMQLSSAKFDLKDNRLRKDGLSCNDCTMRVGANPTLFEPVKPKDDRCLDRTCFQNKTVAFVHITRDALTAKGKKKFGEDYVAPLVVGYTSNHQFPDALTDRQYETVYDHKKCESMEKGVNVTNWELGNTVKICRDRKCPVHYSSGSASGGAKDPGNRAIRKEEIFDAKVRENVRRRVLVEAAPIFGKKFKLTASQPDFLYLLVERCRDRMDDENIMSNFVHPYLETIGKKLEYIYDRRTRVEWFIQNLEDEQIGAFLFLCVNGVKGVMGYDNHYKSQGEIMEIAALYAVNYRLYDAEERLEQCKNKKQRVGLEVYLELVKANEAADIPRFWAPDYVANDSVASFDQDELDAEEGYDEDED